MAQKRVSGICVALTLAVASVGASSWISWQFAKAMDSPLPLRLIADIPTNPVGKAFAGQTPRMDYESIDSGRRMLYIAYLGADELISFNLDTNKVTAHVSGLAGVHGVLAVPELKRVYASATGSDQVAAIDELSLKITARTKGGDYPDGIAYDPDIHKIFVSDEHGGTDTVIDTTTNKTIDAIDLGGDVGNTRYDPVSHQIYALVQTRDDVVVVDPTTDSIVARHALGGCDHDHGLELDPLHRLAFIACDGNAKLLLVDLKDWKVIDRYDVGDEPDVLAFDAGLSRLYVASESGVLAVFEEDGSSLRSLGKAFLADNAHTVAVEPKSHRVYFALQNVGGRPHIRVFSPIDRR